MVPIVPLHPEAHPSGNCNSRATVLWLTLDDRMRINESVIPSRKFRPTITDIMENRTERKVYVFAESGVTYGQFADFMDRVVGASPNLRVILLSGQLRQEVKAGPTFEGLCLLESPEAPTIRIAGIIHFLD